MAERSSPCRTGGFCGGQSIQGFWFHFHHVTYEVLTSGSLHQLQQGGFELTLTLCDSWFSTPPGELKWVKAETHRICDIRV